MKTYSFTITVVGTGLTEREAFRDAKQGFEEKLRENVYDASELIDSGGPYEAIAEDLDEE
jgi:hypothetical protein